MNSELQAALDARLDDAISQANYRLTLVNQKNNARLKLQRDLTYSTSGGIFEITPELISFVQALITAGKDDAILLDVNKNPVEIESLSEFRDTIISKYYEHTNDFLIEFKSLQRKRNTKALVEDK